MAAGRAWPATLGGVAVGDLVFVDETGADAEMSRTHGYARRGERVVEAVPHGHGQAVTFWAGLTASGAVAATAEVGAMAGRRFVAWVGQDLAHRLRPGQVVAMGNLACHEVAGVREAIEAAGCRVAYLPPYSPDLNPIENWFGKFKSLPRSAAARTLDGLFEAMRRALERFTSDDCRGYFQHCGYPAQPT